MYTVGRVARQFGISRSTLLYYDRIGLLTPSGRSGGNYRLYSEKDIDKLAKISLYREAGLPLSEIGKIISGELFNHKAKSVLEQRLSQINKEIGELRNQQQVILRLIEDDNAIKHTRILTRESWAALYDALY